MDKTMIKEDMPIVCSNNKQFAVVDKVVTELLAITHKSLAPSFLEVWRLDATSVGSVGHPHPGPRLVPLLNTAPAVDVDAVLLELLNKSEPQVICLLYTSDAADE